MSNMINELSSGFLSEGEQRATPRELDNFDKLGSNFPPMIKNLVSECLHRKIISISETFHTLKRNIAASYFAEDYMQKKSIMMKKKTRKFLH